MGKQRETATDGVGGTDAPYERARVIAVYWERRVDQATREFHDLRQQLQWTAEAVANNGGATPDDELDQLRELQAEVRRRQRKHKAAKAQVERTKPEDVRRREIDRANNRERSETFLAQLDQIRL